MMLDSKNDVDQMMLASKNMQNCTVPNMQYTDNDTITR